MRRGEAKAVAAVDLEEDSPGLGHSYICDGQETDLPNHRRDLREFRLSLGVQDPVADASQVRRNAVDAMALDTSH